MKFFKRQQKSKKTPGCIHIIDPERYEYQQEKKLVPPIDMCEDLVDVHDVHVVHAKRSTRDRIGDLMVKSFKIIEMLKKLGLPARALRKVSEEEQEKLSDACDYLEANGVLEILQNARREK